MSSRFGKRQSRRGNNAVEFALTAPFILITLFAVFESSYYFNRYMILSTAVRTGARKAAIMPVNSDAETEAEEVIIEYLNRFEPSLKSTSDGGDVQVTATATGARPNRTITVRAVRNNFQSISGGLIPFMPTKMGVSYSLRMEDQLF